MAKGRFSILKILLYPLSIIYGIVIFIRNRLFDYKIFLHSKEYAVPIISVGNITVGGTGKTPHVEYLISILKNECKIATLSRGYKRLTKGFILANENSTVYDIGDEPKQIKHKFPKIDVAVDEKRRRGIENLLTKGNPELNTILLDDAFQHRYIKAGLSILLIDFTQPMFDDHLLPYGRLRENRFEKRRANIIIITKAPEDLKPIERRILLKNLKTFPYQSLYFTCLKYEPLKHLFYSSRDKEANLIKPKDNYTILFLSGISRPELLKKYLENYSDDIQSLTYPDHYTYKEKDVSQIIFTFNEINNSRKIIVTTEKDYMRLLDVQNVSELMNLPIYFVPLKIEFLDNEKIEFDNQIIEYVRKNKRNSSIYKQKSKD